MKKFTQNAIIISLVLSLLLLPVLRQPASAQWVDPPGQTQPTAAPWNWYPVNNLLEDPVPLQEGAVRPLLYVVDYQTDLGGKSVNPYGTFKLTFTIGNNGKDPAYENPPEPSNSLAHARNIVMTFSSTDFDPLDGSVITFYEVDARNAGNETHTHTFKVNDMSTWKYSGQIQAITTYTDAAGTPYSDTFIFTIMINQTGTGSAAATATPSAVDRAQMVVNSYTTDIDPLQPGSAFKLSLNISNAGRANARAVSLVYGGATITTNPEGTPEAGGVSGGGGDTAVFAPIGSSNVVLLGDVPSGGSLKSEQEFIVNVTAQPGAYPLKLSFVYTDAKGNRAIDDQVITLLVYSLPQLEISFYQPVESMFFAGQMGMLPIQITNLARSTVVLGNVVVTSPDGEMSNNSVLVGTLDPGGYFTIDPMFMPFQEGPASINLEIRYTDDFNQLRTYNSQLEVEVMPEMPMPEPYPLLDENGNPVLDEFGNPIMIDPMNPDGFPGEQVEEPGFFARIWNAIKGFFGFGTSNNTSDPSMYQEPGNSDGGGMIIP